MTAAPIGGWLAIGYWSSVYAKRGVAAVKVRCPVCDRRSFLMTRKSRAQVRCCCTADFRFVVHET